MAKAKTKDPNVIRVGDWVEIVKPEFFVRCGYPKTTADYLEEARARYSKMELGGIAWRNRQRIIDQIARAIGYADHFGGRQRSIFTETRESEKGQIYQVVHKKHCYTGVVHDSYWHRDSWTGEEDYEAGYLDPALIGLGPRGWDLFPPLTIDDVGYYIEAVNVKKVTPEVANVV